MKTISLLLGLLLLPLSGCILTSGQITAAFNLGDIHVTGASNLESSQIDLSTNKDYVDHKDLLHALADLAVLGTVQNIGQAVDVEVWMTADQTHFTNAVDVRAHGIKLWGPFSMAAGATRTIDWDGSAALFTTPGKAALLNEIQGDGLFTLYAIGASGNYEFKIPNAQLVLTLDAGI